MTNNSFHGIIPVYIRNQNETIENTNAMSRDVGDGSHGNDDNFRYDVAVEIALPCLAVNSCNAVHYNPLVSINIIVVLFIFIFKLLLFSSTLVTHYTVTNLTVFNVQTTPVGS